MNAFIILAQTIAERGEWWPDSLIGRFWVLFGLGAQCLFTARFLVQWIASERQKRSHVPIHFWYLSIGGAVMLLTYGVFWKQDPVLVSGQSFGIIVYVRNLMILREEKLRKTEGS